MNRSPKYSRREPLVAPNQSRYQYDATKRMQNEPIRSQPKPVKGVKATQFIVDEMKDFEGHWSKRKTTEDFRKALTDYAKQFNLDIAPSNFMYDLLARQLSDIDATISRQMLGNFVTRDWPRPANEPKPRGPVNDDNERLKHRLESNINSGGQWHYRPGEYGLADIRITIKDIRNVLNKPGTIEGKLWSTCASSELLEHVKSAIHPYREGDNVCVFPYENTTVHLTFLELHIHNEKILSGIGGTEFEALQSLIELIEGHPFYSWNWKNYLERTMK